MTIQYPQQFLDKKLQLTPGWLMYFPDPNEVHITRSVGEKPDFSLRNISETPWIEQTFRLLNGQHSLTEVIASAPQCHQAQLQHLLEHMHGHYLYDSCQQQSLLPPWLMQQLALNYTAIEHYTQQLAHKSVTVVGSGWLADALLPLLAKLGLKQIGWLTHADRPQQSLAFTRQQQFHNSDMLVEQLDQLNSDLVIYAEDHFDLMLLKAIDLNSRLSKKRWLFSLIDGWNIALGPCFVPGETSCLQCWLQQQPYYQRLADISQLAHPEVTAFQRDSVNPAFSQIAAGFIATDLTKLLLEQRSSSKTTASLLLGQQTRLNMQTLHSDTCSFYQDQDCRSCSGSNATV